MKLGYRCRWVAIEPKPMACCDNPFEHHLQILIAGRIAEGEHTGSKDIWRDAHDRKKAVSLALWATDRDTGRAQELIDNMIREARERVKQNWAEIAQLAQELLAKKKVTFD